MLSSAVLLKGRIVSYAKRLDEQRMDELAHQRVSLLFQYLPITALTCENLLCSC